MKVKELILNCGFGIAFLTAYVTLSLFVIVPLVNALKAGTFDAVIGSYWFYAGMYLLTCSMIVRLGKNGEQPGQAIAAILMWLLYTGMFVFVVSMIHMVKNHDLAIPPNPATTPVENRLGRD